uniref:Uncharacterized protein n=1 Tax=Aegilops tauschii subsp. strangulata TaxID=200361 RepID=A0A453I792_AEGTS
IDPHVLFSWWCYSSCASTYVSTPTSSLPPYLARHLPLPPLHPQQQLPLPPQTHPRYLLAASAAKLRLHPRAVC